MLSVKDAQSRIIDGLSALAGETVALHEALGRVLSSPLIAGRTQPPADFSAMDGYAICRNDLKDASATFKLSEHISRAGGPVPPPLLPGEAMRLFTGAPLPARADTVVMQEDTHRTGDKIDLVSIPQQGANVRVKGLDFSKGEAVLEAGTRLAPRHIALAASANHATLSVHRKPRIAIIATGDELRAPGADLSENAIIDAVSPALSAFIRARNAEVYSQTRIVDEPDALFSALQQAGDADLIVTVGGASVGDYDIVRSGLDDGHIDLDFWKIAMRPGKPLIFGRFLDTPLIGLPGNPVSALVCTLLFLGPAIDRLSGTSWHPPTRISGKLVGTLSENGKREAYLRAQAENRKGVWRLTPFERQDSSLLGDFARANALIVHAAYEGAKSEGDMVDAYLLDGISST